MGKNIVLNANQKCPVWDYTTPLDLQFQNQDNYLNYGIASYRTINGLILYEPSTFKHAYPILQQNRISPRR
jgi:hypothetical protein